VEIERFADEVAAPGAAEPLAGAARERVVDDLLFALASDWVRHDGDAEDAVCSALVRIGVMTRKGNLVFEFVEDARMSARDLQAMRRYRAWLPAKYSARR
jgi:hypothetical protein